MGFFNKLSTVLSGINKGAIIAATIAPLTGKPGKKVGEVAGAVGATTGVVTAIVTELQGPVKKQVSSGNGLVEGQRQAIVATAVAIDDHEERMKVMEETIEALRRQIEADKRNKF